MNCQTKLRINHLTAVKSFAILEREGNQQYFRVKPKDTDIIEGHSSDLQCHIGNQAGAVQWSKDGFVLEIMLNVCKNCNVSASAKSF
ncbi:UNVERIFIED_CONTAM: hypothetical protein NCL1_06500 [Trichonephila clavipes]